MHYRITFHATAMYRYTKERNTKADRKTVEAISSVLCQVIAENFQSFGLKKKRPPPTAPECALFDDAGIPDAQSPEQLPTIGEMVCSSLTHLA